MERTDPIESELPILDPFVETKLVQQHLANERTFLAWIRTSITIIGLGFLAAGLAFHSTEYNKLAKLCASVAGAGSILFGFLIVILATWEYRKKRIEINRNEFRSSLAIIYVVFFCMFAIGCALAVLIALMLNTQA
jgi:putative membrane protein